MKIFLFWPLVRSILILILCSFLLGVWSCCLIPRLQCIICYVACIFFGSCKKLRAIASYPAVILMVVLLLQSLGVMSNVDLVDSFWWKNQVSPKDQMSLELVLCIIICSCHMPVLLLMHKNYVCSIIFLGIYLNETRTVLPRSLYISEFA
jgi:hypothetical protein